MLLRLPQQLPWDGFGFIEIPLTTFVAPSPVHMGITRALLGEPSRRAASLLHWLCPQCPRHHLLAKQPLDFVGTGVCLQS